MSQLRIKKFRKYLKQENLDAFIVSRHASIQYLSGFTGGTHISPDGILVVTQRGAELLTDSRYWEQARMELKGVRLIRVKGESLTGLKDQKEYQGKNLRIGFESDYLTDYNFNRMKQYLPGALFVATTGAVENLSVIKDASEIACLKRAAEITDAAFARILGYLKPGLRENEVCAELEYQMKVLGADQLAFESIVASGYRSALPHGTASEKKIKAGEFVTFDFGACYKGYTADMTRTVIVGKASARQKKFYNIVLKAQKAAIARVRHGIEAKLVDAAARNIINKAGYGDNFGHGTGHGLGLYIHSRPSVSPKSTDILKRGMVITIEPGIYLAGWGGVRIEDDVVVTSNGGRILNRSPKNLLEI